MNTNTLFEQNSFFLESKLRRFCKRLEKPEGWRGFEVEINKLIRLNKINCLKLNKYVV